MQVKEAVASAKKYLTEIFAEERITDLGLEEIEFDEIKNAWSVTLGFSRPWDSSRGATANIFKPNRSYKIVMISDIDGHPISVKSRDILPTH